MLILLLGCYQSTILDFELTRKNIWFDTMSHFCHRRCQTVPCLFPQELTYASFSNLPQSKDGVSRQLELQESTEYAQIRGISPSPSSLPPSYEEHMQRQQDTTER